MHHKIVTILFFIIFFEACMVIAGWIFGIDPLTRLLPFGINMKFPTAAMFFLSSIGLYFISRKIKENYELSLVVLPAIAMLVFLIAWSIFVAGLFGIQTGIDSAFVQPQVPTESLGAGMPSLATIFCFVLFGLACIVSLFPGRRQQVIFKIFGVFIFMIGLTALLGYALQMPTLYYRFDYQWVEIAFNTALMFMLLGAGLIIIDQEK